MEVSQETCVFVHPRVRRIALNEKDKQFYLDDKFYDKNKILMRPIFYPVSSRASPKVQDLERSLEKKLRSKFNC